MDGRWCSLFPDVLAQSTGSKLTSYSNCSGLYESFTATRGRVVPVPVFSYEALVGLPPAAGPQTDLRPERLSNCSANSTIAEQVLLTSTRCCCCFILLEHLEQSREAGRSFSPRVITRLPHLWHTCSTVFSFMFRMCSPLLFCWQG